MNEVAKKISQWPELVFLVFLIFSPLAFGAPVTTSELPAPIERSPGAKLPDFSLHFQTTTVTQQHGGFTSPYSGVNSLNPAPDSQTSVTMTFFLGAHLWRGAELHLDPELAGGSGFDQTRGIAAFPNGEIYRVGDSGSKWNLARLFLKQTFALGTEKENIKDDKDQLARPASVERLTVIAGKFSLSDFFDNNAYSHDPRTQFLNWALMNNAAWDYAADTRGYSWGLFLEYNRATWAARFATVLVPIEANQIELQTSFPKYRGDNFEFEYRYHVSNQPGVARLLAYENHADMGNYTTTLNTPSDAMDITRSRSLSTKYGFGLNLEQALSDELGLFARLGWNDGHTESWDFTEIDQVLSLGASLRGEGWYRPHDTAGLALVVSGLSSPHKAYFAAGGHGFMLGDGRLDYAPESVVELYYLFELVKGLATTADLQFIEHPAFNKDRGPLGVGSVRVHYEL